MGPSTRSAEFRRVGIVFSGGPAPAANAVIGAAATAFIEDGREVVGFFHGYSNLQQYDRATYPLQVDDHYRLFDERDLRGLRNQPGVIIGTARANPGKAILTPADLSDPTKTDRLRRVYEALVDLEVDALISIGGDDTLRTANLLYLFQRSLPEDAPRVAVVHLPKTIDNDYRGIDFTFGFFTAVDVMAKELMNLRADAMATSSYYVVETMGRKAGWLAYGVAIAGEAHMVIGVEDLDSTLSPLDPGEDGSGQLSIRRLADRIVDTILAREARGKHYGTIVLAEGLAEHLSSEHLTGVPRDEHGHISLADIPLGAMVATKVSARYLERTGSKKKLRGVTMGYESRCAAPHAFDVMLGSQLGVGAYRCLVEQGLDGTMVSVGGQMDLVYVPFADLVDAETLRADVRFIEPGSDFHRLARFLESRVDPSERWDLGRRRE